MKFETCAMEHEPEFFDDLNFVIQVSNSSSALR